jgi:hypothetical protein
VDKLSKAFGAASAASSEAAAKLKVLRDDPTVEKRKLKEKAAAAAFKAKLAGPSVRVSILCAFLPTRVLLSCVFYLCSCSSCNAGWVDGDCAVLRARVSIYFFGGLCLQRTKRRCRP